jgi:hypothetical protein
MSKVFPGISRRVLELMNKSSVNMRGAFKYKEKNLEVFYTT